VLFQNLLGRIANNSNSSAYLDRADQFTLIFFQMETFIDRFLYIFKSTRLNLSTCHRTGDKL